MSAVDCKKILETLTLEEKVGQLVQLGGEFFLEDLKSVETGPSEKIGLSDSFNRYNLGSVINVLDSKEIKEIQKVYLENSRHKIPLLFMADIIHGYQTIFPIPLGQAASFNFELIEKAAEVSARESYYGGQHVTFTPMVDLSRDARWGRISESPGEDPYVNSRFSEAVVRGLQGNEDSIGKEKIAATVKHYVGYGSVESGREYNAVEMSESTLRQFHLPAFKAAVDANVRLVMTAFHTLNGVPATGSKWINNDILRKELGFDGVLISDHSAVKELSYYGYAKDDAEAAKIAMEATVDIDMKTAVYANELVTLVKSEQLDVELLDDAVLRVLELKKDLGLFDNPYRGLSYEADINYEEHLEIALELAEESVVMLKNNNVLPIDKNKKIAIIGPNANNKFLLGMWAITGDASKYETLFEAFQREYGNDRVITSQGANLVDNVKNYGFPEKLAKLISAKDETLAEQDLIEEALRCAQDADVIVLSLGENMLDTGEGGSKVDIELSQKQRELVKTLSTLNKPMVAVINSGRPNVLSELEQDFDAILYAWYGGHKMSEALVNIISGKTNPSGKLPVSLPRHVGQLPLYYNNYSSARPSLKGEKKRFTSRYIDVDNDPLYSFGYGLSYTQFEYSNLKISPKDKSWDITYEVTNTGDREGYEVSQLYIHVPVSKIVRPVLELKGIQKTLIKPGEVFKGSFELTLDDINFYDNANSKIETQGSVEVFVGSSSNELNLESVIEL